jgi:hypothetical protein
MNDFTTPAPMGAYKTTLSGERVGGSSEEADMISSQNGGAGRHHFSDGTHEIEIEMESISDMMVRKLLQLLLLLCVESE